MNQVYPTTVNVMLDLLSAAGRACTNIHYAIESDIERGVRYDDLDFSALAFPIQAARNTMRTAVEMFPPLVEGEAISLARADESFSIVLDWATGEGLCGRMSHSQRMSAISWDIEYKIASLISEVRASLELRYFAGRGEADDDE